MPRNASALLARSAPPQIRHEQQRRQTRHRPHLVPRSVLDLLFLFDCERFCVALWVTSRAKQKFLTIIATPRFLATADLRHFCAHPPTDVSRFLWTFSAAFQVDELISSFDHPITTSMFFSSVPPALVADSAFEDPLRAAISV